MVLCLPSQDLKLQREHSNTAILLFTHDAEIEVKHKCFSAQSSRKVNKLIAESLIRSAKNKIIKSGIPYFIITTKNQSGNTFGERLVNAIDCVFNQGFEKVIVTGNDSPDLSSDTLVDTKELLNNNDVVIGPTTKGGTYLIAISKKYFDKKAFKNLPWQSSRLLQGLINYAQLFSNSHRIIQTLDEINSTKDLYEYIKNSYRNRFSRLLISLVSINSTKTVFQRTIRLQEVTRYLFRITAPPALMS